MSRPRKSDPRLHFVDQVRFQTTGLLKLCDGGVEVIRTRTAVRCVANLLDIRAKHARESIAGERGIAVDEVADSHLVDYELPGSAVAACHKELADQVQSALVAYHEHRQSEGVAKTSFNIRAAYPQLVSSL